VLLVHQWRTPADGVLLEIPAGTLDVVDRATGAIEDPDLAARRELEEETGYRADELVALFEGPIAVGVSDEVVSFFHARGLTRVGEGGGDDTEDIIVHEVPLAELTSFLEARSKAGLGVDPKIYAGLFLAGVALPG